MSTNNGAIASPMSIQYPVQSGQGFAPVVAIATIAILPIASAMTRQKSRKSFSFFAWANQQTVANTRLNPAPKKAMRSVGALEPKSHRAQMPVAIMSATSALDKKQTTDPPHTPGTQVRPCGNLDLPLVPMTAPYEHYIRVLSECQSSFLAVRRSLYVPCSQAKANARSAKCH